MSDNHELENQEQEQDYQPEETPIIDDDMYLDEPINDDEIVNAAVAGRVSEILHQAATYADMDGFALAGQIAEKSETYTQLKRALDEISHAALSTRPTSIDELRELSIAASELLDAMLPSLMFLAAAKLALLAHQTQDANLLIKIRAWRTGK